MHKAAPATHENDDERRDGFIRFVLHTHSSVSEKRFSRS